MFIITIKLLYFYYIIIIILLYFYYIITITLFYPTILQSTSTKNRSRLPRFATSILTLQSRLLDSRSIKNVTSKEKRKKRKKEREKEKQQKSIIAMQLGEW